MTALITYDQIAALQPCWIRDGRAHLLREYVGSGVTARQISDDERVSVADRRWLLTNLLSRGPRADRMALVRWAAQCAASSLHLIGNDRTRGAATNCVEVVLLWTVGDATIEEVRAARSAATAAYAADSDATARAARAADATARAADADSADAYAAAYAADAAADAADATARAADAYAAAYAADAAAYAAADAAYADARKKHETHWLRELAAIIDAISVTGAVML